MANMERIVNIIFQGEAKSLTGVVTDINQGLELFQKTLDAILDPLARVADGVIEVDEAMVHFALTLGKEAVGAFQDYESACIDLKRLMAEQIDQWEETEAAIHRMSDAYGETITDIANTAAEFKRAGFDMERTMKMTEGAIRMLITGNTDLGTATRALIQIFKGYQFEAERVTEVVDSLINTSLKYATNVEKLGIAVSEISRIMKDMGYSFQETIGHAIPIIEVFQSGEEAATSLKTAFARLASGSAPVMKVFHDLELDFRDANHQLKSGKQLMEEFTGALQGLSKIEQQYYINRATGIRQGQKLVLVMGDMAKVTEVTTEALDSQGATQEQINQKMEASAMATKKYNAALNKLHVAIGSKIDPSTQALTESLTQLVLVLEGEVRVNTFNALQEAIEDTEKRLEAFIEAVADALPRALMNIDWSNLLQAWNDLIDTLEEFLDSIDVSKPEDLEKVLQFLVDTMESLIRVTEGMLEPLGNLASDVVDAIKAFNDLTDEEKKNIGMVVAHGKIFKELGFIIRGALQTISEASKDTYSNWQQMDDTVSGFKDKIVSHFSSIMLAAARSRQADVEGLMETYGTTEDLKKLYDQRTKDVEYWAKKTGESYNSYKEKEERFTIDTLDSFDEVNKKIAEQNVNMKISEKTWQAHVDVAKYLRKEIDEIPNVKKIKLEDHDTFAEINKVAREFGHYLLIELPDERVVLITPETKKEQWERIQEELKKLSDDREVAILPTLDETKLEEIKDTLEKDIPEKKKVELILEGVDILKRQLTDVETGFKNVETEDGVRDIRLTWQEGEKQKLMNQLNELMQEVQAVTKEGQEPDAWTLRILVENLEKTEEDIQTFMDRMEEAVSDELTVDIKAEVNEAALKYAKQKLEEGIPDEIVVDILLAGTAQFEAETKKFEAETKRIGDAIQAQVDITTAQIQADAETFQSTMESLSSSIDSVAGAAADMFDSLTSYLSDIVTDTDKANDSFQEMENAVEEIEDAFKDMFAGWEDFIDNIEDALDAIDDMKDRLEEIPGVIEDIIDRVAEIPDELEDINKELEELREEWKELRKEDRNYWEDKEEQLEEEKEMLEEIGKDLSDINEIKREEREISEEEQKILDKIKKLEKERKKLIKEQIQLEKDRQAALDEQLEIQEEIIKKYEEIKQHLEDIGLLTEEWEDTLDDALSIIGEMSRQIEILKSRGLIDDEEYDEAMRKLKEFKNLLETVSDVDLGDPTTWTEGMKDAIKDLGFEFDELAKHFDKTYKEGVGIAEDYAGKLEDMVQQQLDMQRHLINAQADLAEKQGKLIDARIDALKRGDAVINVDGAGLQPELEAFMWKIIETIQVRANAEYSEFLLGLAGMPNIP